MKIASVTALLTAVLFAIPCSLPAQEATETKAGKKVRGGAGFGGLVTAVDDIANTITITPGKKQGGEAKTFTVTDETEITVDGKPATIDDIKVKMRAAVVPGTPETVAASVAAKGKPTKEGKKERGKKDAKAAVKAVE